MLCCEIREARQIPQASAFPPTLPFSAVCKKDEGTPWTQFTAQSSMQPTGFKLNLEIYQGESSGVFTVYPYKACHSLSIFIAPESGSDKGYQ